MVWNTWHDLNSLKFILQQPKTCESRHLNLLSLLNMYLYQVSQGFQPIPVNDIAYTSKFYLYKCDSSSLKFTEICWKKLFKFI